jgi:HK97 family phage portal protein
VDNLSYLVALWKRRPAPTQSGEALAAGTTGTGISGDIEGASELLRRRWEQSAIDNGDGWSNVPGSFPWVSEWSARQIPALTAGMRLISGVVMQMPLQHKRGDEVVDPPAAIIANPTPGPNRTLADFVDEYVSDVLFYGNYAALIALPDSTGWPAQLIPLDVTTVSVGRDPKTWQPVYAIAGWDMVIPANLMFHVAIDKRSGELRGRGLIPTMSSALNATLAADAYAGRYFTESGVPSGVISDSRPNLTQEQATELKQKWKAAVSGTPTPVVVPSSTTFQPLATDADKAQLVQARQWDATMVAMALGVPPFLLGIETQRHTYTNAENEFGRFIATTIMRLLTPLEQQLGTQCLPRGNAAQFATAALLRPDTATRASAAATLYAAGLITLEEARTMAGFPAAGGPAQSSPVPAPTPAPAAEDSPGAGDEGRSTILEVVS